MPPRNVRLKGIGLFEFVGLSPLPVVASAFLQTQFGLLPSLVVRSQVRHWIHVPRVMFEDMLNAHPQCTSMAFGKVVNHQVKVSGHIMSIMAVITGEICYPGYHFPKFLAKFPVFERFNPIF